MPACALRPDMADCLGFRRRRIARKLRYFPMSNGRSVRPEGFEPPAGCLEGSCSVRLSYGRPNVIVHGQDHVTATRRSQCVGLWRRRFAPASANSPPYPNPPSTMPVMPSPKPLNCGSAPARLMIVDSFGSHWACCSFLWCGGLAGAWGAFAGMAGGVGVAAGLAGVAC
jgi:hypothetical protein